MLQTSNKIYFRLFLKNFVCFQVGNVDLFEIFSEISYRQIKIRAPKEFFIKQILTRKTFE